MALRTVSNTGGNWNATTAWVGGVVPIAGDTVDFTATSGNLTVNVSTANLVGINFTNYVGTITFNNPINTNGTVNLGTGGYTQDGANGLVINGTTTLTSNNVVWSRTLTTSNVGTITLADNCTVTGNITLNSSSTTTINGNILYVKGNLTLTTLGNVFIIGTTLFEFSGNGTWSSTAGGQLRNNVTINTTGTLTLGTSVAYNTGILTYISGTVDSTTNSSTLGIGLGCTLNTSGMTWNNITINNSTITLTSDLNIGGTLTTTTSGANIVINGLFNVNVSGNLTINVTCSGTSTIILNGTGSQTWSHGSVVYLSNSLTINKTSGTLTIGANVYYNTGTLTYTAGTIDTTTNNSTLNINTSVTLNTSTIVWINVTISPTNTSVITLSSNFNTLGTLTLSSTNSISISFSGVGTLNPSGPLGISTGVGTNGTLTINLLNDISVTNLTIGINGSNYSVVINNNTINISGNLTKSGATNLVGIIRGTTAFILNGTGTWSHNSASPIQNNLTINSPSGTITIGTNVYYNTGILTYTIGTVDTTTNNSTLNISSSTTLNTNGINWNNVILTGTQTLNSDLNIGGNLTTQTSTVAINGLFNVNVGGNLTINIGTSGTSTIILNGTGAQTWSHGSVVYLSNNLTINKSSGTLSIGTNVYYNTGTLTYTAGTVDTTTNNSTLNINTTTTLNTSTVSWNNVTIAINANTIITLSSNFNNTGLLTLSSVPTGASPILSFTGVGLLNPIGSLTISHSSGSGGAFTVTIPNNLTVTNLTFAALTFSTTTFTLNGNTINVTGNLTVGTTAIPLTTTGTTNINLIGTGTWSHTSVATLRNNLTINSPSGTITISGNIYYNTGTLTYTAGTVITTGSTLNLTTSTTLNCGNMDGITTNKWNNVTLSGTQTLTSNLNVGGNLTTTTTAVIINGLFNINVGGNLTINITTSGTSTIEFNGTGAQTWSHGAALYLYNNTTINKSTGTLTIGANIYYTTGTLTYTTGTVDTTTNNSTLNTQSPTTFNTSVMTWNNVIVNVYVTTSVITLTSNFNVSGTLTLIAQSQAGITTPTLSFSGVGLLNPSGTLIISHVSGGANISFTVTIPNNLTVTNLTTSATVYNPSVITLNGNTINVTGNLTVGTSATIPLTTTGTTNINLIGTGVWSHAVVATLRNNLTINSPSGTITISGNVYYNTGTLTYTAGSVITTSSTLNITANSTLNISGVTWNNVTLSGAQTLSSDLNIGGNLTTQTTAVVFIGLFNVNVIGNLTINITTSGVSTPIILNGAGNQTWSHGSAVYLSNNLTINKSLGTLTIGTNVYYRTGTLTYTAGTVDTTTNSSTLNINASTTLNSNGLSWNNLTISSNTTLTLPTDLIFIGTCSMVGSGTTTITLAGVGIINAILGTLQLTVSGGNLTLTTSATHNILNYQFNAGGFAIISSGTWNVYGNLIRNGTSNGRSATGTINFLGSGSILFNGGSTGAFVGVWNINPSGTLTFGSVTFPNVYYEQSTITYIGGTVDASNCNLLIGFTITSQTTTLNTSPINWKNITLSGTNTLLLTSNLNLTGNLTTQSGVITINGLFNVNVGGNLTINFTTNGTSTIVLNGTGTQTWLTAGYYLSNNLTFNKPSGTLTIGTNVYYQTGTITYVTGTIDTTTNNSTLILGSSTIFNTNTLFWSNIYISTNATITLNSILLIGSFTVNQFTLSWVTNNYTVSISGDMVIGSTFYGGGSSTTVSIPNDVYVKNLTLNTTAYNSTTGIYPTVVNGSNIYVSGNLTIGNYSYITNPITGTSGIILNGTGTFSMSFNGFVYASLNNNLTINTGGVITFLGNLLYNTGTLTYLSGKVITKNSVLYLQSSTTLINCNKINFDRVIITGGVTITMNQFFDGNPNLKTNISSSSTNYTITFQDGFEKFSKFIKLSRATISRPNQLTVITDKGNQGNNVGVKFAPNQLANGLPKNTPSTSIVSPYGLQPSYLMTDPTLS